MLVQNLDDVSLDTFKQAIYNAVTSKITSVAPLGYSTPTILLYGNNGDERRCGVSVRNHSGTVSMLICDLEGRFLYHGGYNKKLPVDFVANEYFDIFLKMKPYMEKALPKNEEVYSVSVDYSYGFDLLAAAQRGLFI